MGNCYYKINDVANAILFYERSILINPADEDCEEQFANGEKFTNR